MQWKIIVREWRGQAALKRGSSVPNNLGLLQLGTLSPEIHFQPGISQVSESFELTSSTQDWEDCVTEEGRGAAAEAVSPRRGSRLMLGTEIQDTGPLSRGLGGLAKDKRKTIFIQGLTVKQRNWFCL